MNRCFMFFWFMASIVIASTAGCNGCHGCCGEPETYSCDRVCLIDNVGDSCGELKDCCSPLSCIKGRCRRTLCGFQGERCADFDSCCSGTECVGGYCQNICASEGSGCEDRSCCGTLLCEHELFGDTCRSCRLPGGVCTSVRSCCAGPDYKLSHVSCGDIDFFGNGKCKGCWLKGGACTRDPDCCSGVCGPDGTCEDACHGDPDCRYPDRRMCIAN
ncbi:MAG: hypothetical protein WC889_17200, partial [Myxococcota bacterium]